MSTLFIILGMSRAVNPGIVQIYISMYRIYDSLWTFGSPTSRGRGSVPRHLCKANDKEREL